MSPRARSPEWLAAGVRQTAANSNCVHFIENREDHKPPTTRGRLEQAQHASCGVRQGPRKLGRRRLGQFPAQALVLADLLRREHCSARRLCGGGRRRQSQKAREQFDSSRHTELIADGARPEEARAPSRHQVSAIRAVKQRVQSRQLDARNVRKLGRFVHQIAQGRALQQ